MQLAQNASEAPELELNVPELLTYASSLLMQDRDTRELLDIQNALKDPESAVYLTKEQIEFYKDNSHLIEEYDPSAEFIRYIVFWGGRGSAKSWTVARLILIGLVLGFFDRVVCAREIQRSIKDSVKKLLEDQIKLLGLDHYFNIQADRIIVLGRNGAEIIFMGLYRNVSQIKSLEGCDVLWIEEAENLTKESWDIVDPTVRRLGSRIILTYNPQLLTDFVIQRFQHNPPSNAIVVKINYIDNPFCALATVKQAKQMKDEDLASYNHVFLGECLGESDLVIISSAWIDSAIDAHLKLADIWDEDIAEPSGDHRIGFDPCDEGDDFNGLAGFKEYLVTALDEWKGKAIDIEVSTGKAWEEVRSLGANCFNYDVIGIGTSVTISLKTLDTTGVMVGKFDAGGAVSQPDKLYKESKKNRDTFYNIKAQRWWQLRDRFMKTHLAVTTGRRFPMHELISIPSELPQKLIDKLKMELSAPQQDRLAGKHIVESKKKLAKRGIPSHNIADALVMATHDHTELQREVRGEVY